MKPETRAGEILTYMGMFIREEIDEARLKGLIEGEISCAMKDQQDICLEILKRFVGRGDILLMDTEYDAATALSEAVRRDIYSMERLYECLKEEELALAKEFGVRAKETE